MKFFKQLLLGLLAALFSLSVQASDIAPDALSLAVGTWGTENSVNEEDPERVDYRKCGKSPVIVTIDRINMRYKAVHTGEDFTAEADVLDVKPRYLSVRYDDEDRLMENGEPQIWHMVFVSDNRFYWVVGPGVSEDERDGVVTVARVRCETFMS